MISSFMKMVDVFVVGRKYFESVTCDLFFNISTSVFGKAVAREDWNQLLCNLEYLHKANFLVSKVLKK